MDRDPIVEEVRRARADLLAQAGGDLDRLIDMLKELEPTSFAERLRNEIASCEFHVDGCSVRVTVSVGGAVWPLHGLSLEAVIETANRAERAAKEGGKNCVRTATA